MAPRISALLSAAALLASPSLGHAATDPISTPPHQSPTAGSAFVCKALRMQTCYFRIISATVGAGEILTVKGQSQLAVPGLSPGKDRYLLTINRAPPATEAQCGSGQFDKRFSLWCRKAVVQSGENY